MQRWLKFVKYLREFGWEPIVYTPENPEMPAVDEGLLQEIPEGVQVLKTKIWEPYSYYKKFTGKREEEKIQTAFLNEKKSSRGVVEKLSVWIRGNFFIPDARKYWIKPSVKFLSKHLKEHPVEAIISTGPPHSMHLIAMDLQKKLNIPWLADFRDPWTNIDYYQDLRLGKRADMIHHKMEKTVLSSANAVTVISPGMAKEFSLIFDREFSVIPNGYDAEDMKGLPDIKLDTSKFIISHIGSLTRTRNPKNLWKVLNELCVENRAFNKALEIHIIGKIDFSVKDSIQAENLEIKLVISDYLSHDEVLVEQRKANVLLLLVNDTPNAKLILTGKLFEYLAAGRPVICIGPKDGDAAQVLEETKCGVTFDFDNINELKKRILTVYNERNSTLNIVEGENIEKYERKNLTKKMVQVLNSCIASPQGFD